MRKLFLWPQRWYKWYEIKKSEKYEAKVTNLETNTGRMGFEVIGLNPIAPVKIGEKYSGEINIISRKYDNKKLFFVDMLNGIKDLSGYRLISIDDSGKVSNRGCFA